jgi:hypothetical protein
VGGGRITPRPCPRLLIFNPFGVQTHPRSIVTGTQETSGPRRGRTVRPLQGRETWMACNPWAAGAKPRALAHGYLSSTPSGFRRTHGQLSTARKKRLVPGGAERFDPSRVEKLGWRAICGRRAQNLAPLPTATHLQPLRGSDEKAVYIDLDPARVGLAKRAEEWQWCSVRDYTAGLSATSSRILKNLCERRRSDPERSEGEESRSANKGPARFLVVRQ